MVEKRNKNLFLILIFLVVILLMYFVLAATTMNLPVAGGNYSGNITINITVDANGVNNMTNITCYYNQSAGPATTFLVEMLNDSVDDTEFVNTTISLTDASTYNISCSIYNGTTLNQTISVSGVTIDNTAPNVTFSGITNTINNGNYSGTIVLNVSVVDATIGVGSVYFNITNSSNDQLNFSKASTPGGDYYNISVDITGFTDGAYNITVFSNDSLNNLNNTERIQITIDNTAPYEINFTSTTVNYGNYSGNLVVNVSVLDATAGVSSVFFNITNSSGDQNGTYAASNSGVYWYATINTSNFPDGQYNITVWANDSVQNQNKTAVVYNVTFDNTAPATVNIDCTSISVDSVVCTCTSTDATSGIASNSFTENPSTTNSGTFPTSCTSTDHAGNTATESTTYTVGQRGGDSSSGPSGGTSSSWTRTVTVSKEKFASGYTIKLSANQRLKVSVGTETHYVGVKSLTSKEVKIEVSSIPVTFTLNIGESNKVDVEDDGYYEIYVKLLGIANNDANLIVQEINERVPATSPPVEEALVEEEREAAPAPRASPSIEEEGKGRMLLTIILIALAIGVGVWFFINKKKFK